MHQHITDEQKLRETLINKLLLLDKIQMKAWDHRPKNKYDKSSTCVLLFGNILPPGMKLGVRHEIHEEIYKKKKINMYK